MIIVNTQEVTGKKTVKTLGVVRGSSVRAKWFGKDILAGFRNIVGGELKEYKELLDEAREAAMQRMINDATKIGANAIVNIHFMTAAVSSGAAEILVYGTAVVVQ
ncbi:MAG: YbjQ family protein [Nanoarchaeota archaeon]